MDYSVGYKVDYAARSKERYLQRRKQARMQRLFIAVAIILTVTILSIVFGAIFTYADSKSNVPEREKCYKSVMVQSGDTLTSIADAYISAEYSDTTQYINEVMHINYLQDESIQAGNCIVIPYYTQVL